MDCCLERSKYCRRSHFHRVNSCAAECAASCFYEFKFFFLRHLFRAIRHSFCKKSSLDSCKVVPLCRFDFQSATNISQYDAINDALTSSEK